MERKNPNIYQRALDIVNSRINPDIPQGGSGGNDDVFVVTFTPDEDGGIQCDRTPDEITEAAKDKSVVGLLAMHEGAGVAVQTAVVSVWVPGFAENFQFPVFNQDPDRVSVIEIDYDEDEDAWTIDEFEYEFGGGSGDSQYDFVIVSEDGETYSFETGSYDAIVSKIKSAPVTGTVRIQMDDLMYYSIHQVMNVQYICQDPEEDTWVLGVIVFGAESEFQLLIHEDNTITSAEDDAEG